MKEQSQSKGQDKQKEEPKEKTFWQQLSQATKK
jgi:hypothetical protein